ncbi:stearoyl-CoA desaturase 5 isoform X2 [Patella vulgata]|nr:stearoyl-CoA desaturase 5 isoform X2 [Patella vulgata]XP_050392755.1 stearoyl-CoA desaturase 5 isoform X2 [Patella vulgata]
MPPRNIVAELTDPDGDVLSAEAEVEPVITEETHSAKRPPMKVVWKNVVIFSLLHLASFYSLFLIPKAHYYTLIWVFLFYLMGGLGITAGAHRLWSHRSYKAKLLLRIILGIFQTIAVQNDIIEWARDHRLHHKTSETDADPHNAKRGFFFAHIGWLLVRKHPEVKNKGKTVDLSDLYADPVCVVQRKIYRPAVILLSFVLPAVIPYYCWGESLWNAFYLASILRLCIGLNVTWLVNSAAHIFGNHPYDRRISPAQNVGVTLGAIGEGFHNYHHVFPYDYSTSEYGWYYNLTTFFIDFWAYFGQVTERRKIPKEVIERRKKRTGDGTEGFNF